MCNDPLVGVLSENPDLRTGAVLPDRPHDGRNVVGELLPRNRHRPVAGRDEKSRGVGPLDTELPERLENHE